MTKSLVMDVPFDNYFIQLGLPIFNKKFPEADYPQGRAIEIPTRQSYSDGFRPFHFDLRVNNQNLYLTSPRTARKGSSDLSQGEVNPSERHGQDLGNHLD